MSTLTNLFAYGFVIRGFEAGIIVALVAPLIGIFLVLRRYSLIADTLSHISLAGIAAALLLGLNPILTAVGTTLVASVGIERIRASKRVYGESALALFMSGGLAIAIILISLGKTTANISSYLFGSILTVTQNDVYLIAAIATCVGVALFVLFQQLVYVSFDEEAAQVSGVPVVFVNMALIFLTALIVSIAIPIAGVLLISALIVIPVVTALQLKKNFLTTLLMAECVSVGSVVGGIIASFYLNISASGTIVLLMLVVFLATLAITTVQRGKRCC